MTYDYRIEPQGDDFLLIYDGETDVDIFPTEDAAKQHLEHCKKEDEMWEAAKSLVDIAIRTHMKMFEVDYETSSYWISSASARSLPDRDELREMSGSCV